MYLNRDKSHGLCSIFEKNLIDRKYTKYEKKTKSKMLLRGYFSSGYFVFNRNFGKQYFPVIDLNVHIKKLVTNMIFHRTIPSHCAMHYENKID